MLFTHGHSTTCWGNLSLQALHENLPKTGVGAPSIFSNGPSAKTKKNQHGAGSVLLRFPLRGLAAGCRTRCPAVEHTFKRRNIWCACCTAIDSMPRHWRRHPGITARWTAGGALRARALTKSKKKKSRSSSHRPRGPQHDGALWAPNGKPRVGGPPTSPRKSKHCPVDVRIAWLRLPCACHWRDRKGGISPQVLACELHGIWRKRGDGG